MTDRLFRNGETFTVDLYTDALPDDVDAWCGESGGGYARSGDVTWASVSSPVSFCTLVEVDPVDADLAERVVEAVGRALRGE